MMIRYIEAPDVHANKRWLDTTLEILEAIKKAAIKEKVDFITFPGDLHDTDFYVSDGSGYNKFRKKIKELLEVCPVVAIEGTPGHESKGVYSPLEDLGLVLLQPGKVYGLLDGIIGEIVGSYTHPLDCILFGIPELNKNNIQAKLHLPAEAANAKTVELFGDYVDSFIAPMRLKYKEVPAVALLHGVVSDSSQENSTDVIIKASSIVLHTETLERAGVDRWTLGDIHTPWESSLISAGYAGYPGIDRNPWGKRDFVPAMNLIEIHPARKVTDIQEQPEADTIEQTLKNAFEHGKHLIGRSVDITRLPYGTPERRKITDISQIESGNIAYWLVTEDPEAVLPLGLHPWSRITFAEDITETRRVSAHEAEKAKTLWDLFKLFDPTIHPHLKDKIDTIPIKNSITGKKLNVVLTGIKAVGCDLFGGKTVNFNLDNLAMGLNQLIGTNGNGDGKSSLLGMCSLYPCVVGKDTKSGRRSALKDFFSGQNSFLEKTAIVNGEIHHHLITIKAAHTQNPKVECFLEINGIPQLEKATFDVMFEKCEELYGDYEDYLLTTFYEQPQQSKSQRSGLMTATMSEARNLVQNIAGTDRDMEKRFALDAVAVTEKKAGQLESDIAALEEYSEDMEDLKTRENIKIDAIVASGLLLEEAEKKGSAARSTVDSLQLKVTDNEKAKTEKEQTNKHITYVENAIKVSRDAIEDLQIIVKNLPENQNSIKKDNETKKLELGYTTLLLEYNQIMNDHDKLVSKQREEIINLSNTINSNKTRIETIKKEESGKLELEFSEAMNKYNLTMQTYNTACIDQNNSKREYQGNIDNAEVKKQSANKEIELISKPCPECGYIDPDIQENVDVLNRSIAVLDDLIEENFEAISKFKPIKIPTVMKPVQENFVDSDEIKKLETEITAIKEEVKSFQNIPTPDIIKPIKPSESLSAFERTEIEKDVTEGMEAATTMKGLESGIIKDSKLLEAYQSELKDIKIDSTIDDQLGKANIDLEEIRALYSSTQKTISTMEAEKKALSDRIQKAEEGEKSLNKKRSALKITESDRTDWQYIALNLSSHKLPAMELDIILDSIDSEATRTIEPFLEGRYSFRTITQSHGKKSTVDRFDIMVHDAETGKSFSMFFTNPGNKAFYSDCYIKALIRKRNERQMRSYSPIIYDEADGPVNPLRVKAYYEIQQAYFQTEKVLIVSQKDITSAYVEKVFNIEEMKS